MKTQIIRGLNKTLGNILVIETVETIETCNIETIETCNIETISLGH